MKTRLVIANSLRAIAAKTAEVQGVIPKSRPEGTA